MVQFSKRIRLKKSFVTLWLLCKVAERFPRPRVHNACRLEHKLGLGWFPFARRYLGSRVFFLFLELLRCFSSLRAPPKPMYSV